MQTGAGIWKIISLVVKRQIRFELQQVAQLCDVVGEESGVGNWREKSRMGGAGVTVCRADVDSKEMYDGLGRLLTVAADQ